MSSWWWRASILDGETQRFPQNHSQKWDEGVVSIAFPGILYPNNKLFLTKTHTRYAPCMEYLPWSHKFKPNVGKYSINSTHLGNGTRLKWSLFLKEPKMMGFLRCHCFLYLKVVFTGWWEGFPVVSFADAKGRERFGATSRFLTPFSMVRFMAMRENSEGGFTLWILFQQWKSIEW